MRPKAIIINPTILSGKPIFTGTRIPIYLVLELLESGLTPQEIVNTHYPRLTIEDIKSAIHYAALLTKQESFQLIKAA